MTLDTITDNLRDGYKRLKEGSFQHVDELLQERRGSGLRCQEYHTADGILYFSYRNIPKLALTREVDNLLLRHIDESFQMTVEDYHPSIDEVKKAVASKSTVVINLKKLRLSGYGLNGQPGIFQYLSIDPRNYDTLNEEERKLARRVYGKGNDFKKNMQMLACENIGETRIYVLNPDYALQETKDGPIALGSWLNILSGSSLFYAGSRNITGDGQLRGSIILRRY